MLSTFLDQGGAPIVSATLDCSGKTPKVQLRQRRYLPLGSKGESARIWSVPLCVRYGMGSTTGRACTVLETERAELPLPEAKVCPEWLFPNAEGAGYYRTEVTGDALRKLLTVADKHLTRAERVTLLGDSSALAKAGALPAGDALAMAARFAEDPDRQVVAASTDLLDVVDERMLSDQRRADYKRFLRETYGPRARKLGLTPRPGEDEDTRLLRPMLICLAGRQGEDPKLVAEVEEARLEVAGGPQGHLPGRRVRGAGDRLGERGHGVRPEVPGGPAKKEPERKVRQQLLGALASTKDPQLVRQLLPMVLDPGQRRARGDVGAVRAVQDPAMRELVYSAS